MIKSGEKIVVIVGLAATGKTGLAKKLAENHSSYKVFHADDYLRESNPESAFIGDVVSDPSECKIIEGTMAYQLLKRGFSERYFHPDLVIELVAETHIRIQRCLNRGTSVNLGQQDSMLRSIWREYLNMVTGDVPRVITYNSDNKIYLQV
jgi:dephospho-CoA kinase